MQRVKQAEDQEHVHFPQHLPLCARALFCGCLLPVAVLPLCAQVVALSGDITASEAPALIAEALKAEFGRVDVLVNNAGVSTLRVHLRQFESTVTWAACVWAAAWVTGGAWLC